MKQFISLFILGFSYVNAFYESNSKVIKLTADNFQSQVIDTDDVWLIEFYAPWCGHCKALAPEFDKAAKALDGIVKLGAVDMTTDGEAGRPYEISGYPTIKFFGQDKQTPVNFEGERKKRGIIDYCLEKAREVSINRLGLKVTPSAEAIDESNVIVLTDTNFESLVYSSNDAWFVEFYAPWCKHWLILNKKIFFYSKKLAPEWARLATKVKDIVKIAKVDATVETKLAERFKVEGFPSIKFFPAGSKSDSNVEEYGGDREFQELHSYLKKKLSTKRQSQENVIALEQLADQGTFNQKCHNGKTCLISFLPPIEHSSAEERQLFISILKNSAGAAGVKNINFLWANGGDFEEFESDLNVLGSSYPANVIINSKKQQFYVQRNFIQDQIVNFIKNVSNGQENGYDYTDFSTLKLKQDKKRDDL